MLDGNLRPALLSTRLHETKAEGRGLLDEQIRELLYEAAARTSADLADAYDRLANWVSGHHLELCLGLPDGRVLKSVNRPRSC